MIPEASAAPTLTVSIVVYRSDLPLLESTLRHLFVSLERACQAGRLGAARVVVRDNASPRDYADRLDERIAALQPSCPAGVTLVLSESERNTGYGSGCNHALAGASDDLILVLNPDVELVASALVEGLGFLARHPDVVALGPSAHSADGTREYLCKRYPSVLDLLLRGFGGAFAQSRFPHRLARYEYRELDGSGAQDVVLLSGACLLMRAEAFRQVGGFDERFFMYFEDFDISMRLHALGRLVYVPTVRVRHHGGKAARKGWRHRFWFIRSAVRFFRRHGWRFH